MRDGAGKTDQKHPWPRWRRRLAGGLLCVCAASIAMAAPPGPSVATPLVDPPSSEHHVGKFIFVELVTPDVAAARTFYGSLFGWTFRDVQGGGNGGEGRYVEALLDGDPVAGMVQRPIRASERRGPAWLSFVAVTDVDAARKAAQANGGKSLYEPHDVPGLGRLAVLGDPQGAVIGVLASSSGDPSDVLPSVGDWLWASLFTTDPDAAAAFYQTLFDYEVFDDPAPGADHHLILSSDGYARAAANPLPSEKAPPHWLNYVRVDDAPAMAAKVVALGGKVLLTPRNDRHGGRLAIVADPQGAPFGLLEWSEDNQTKAMP